MTRAAAARLLPLIDLTSLNDARDDAVRALAAKARTRHGPVAAVCSWPEHVAALRRALPAARPPRIAAVVNFPRGAPDAGTACAEAKAAVAAGAEELDLVWPYHDWLAGAPEAARALVAAVRAVAPGARLKVILETGAFGGDSAAIAAAGRDAIAAGADMLRTSTGKIAEGASPAAARALLEVLRRAERPVGFKASGGIRTLAAAASYLALAERIMGPGWAAPETFRIGASRLLDEVLAALDAPAKPG